MRLRGRGARRTAVLEAPAGTLRALGLEAADASCYLQGHARHDVIDVWQVSAAAAGTPGTRALRRILCSYLGGDPAALAFELGPHGKPALAGHDLQFSFSRSGDVALVAVSRGRPVGVDVERVKPGRADGSHRAPPVRARPRPRRCAAAGPAERDAAFHRCWTARRPTRRGSAPGSRTGSRASPWPALVEGAPRCAVGAWEVRAAADAPQGMRRRLPRPGRAGGSTRLEVSHG